MLIFLVTSWITTFVIAMQYNYVARVEEPFALFDQLYDKPWMRIGPYLVGMATGYILFRFDGKIKLPSYVVVSGWILAVGLVLSLVYGLGKGELVTPVSAIYVRYYLIGNKRNIVIVWYQICTLRTILVFQT